MIAFGLNIAHLNFEKYYDVLALLSIVLEILVCIIQTNYVNIYTVVIPFSGLVGEKKSVH